jgi:hypothetical protein
METPTPSKMSRDLFICQLHGEIGQGRLGAQTPGRPAPRNYVNVTTKSIHPKS